MHRFLAIGAMGVLALALCGGAAAWSWPAEGEVLRPFVLGADAYASGQHRGIDVAGPDGAPVRAPAPGVVTFAGSLPTYGRGVTILTADGYSVTLVHLGAIGVSEGDTVTEGETVGTMGSSGTPEQSVPSVHLGVRRASEEEGYVDPLGLLPPRAAPAPPAVDPEPAPAPSPVPVSPAVPVQPPPPPPPAPDTASAPEPSVTAAPVPSSPAVPATPTPLPPAATAPVAAAPAAAPTAAETPPQAQPEPSHALARAAPPGTQEGISSSRADVLSPRRDAFIVIGKTHEPAAVHARTQPGRVREAGHARPTSRPVARPALAVHPAPAGGVGAEPRNRAGARGGAGAPSPTRTAFAAPRPAPVGSSGRSPAPHRGDVAAPIAGREGREVRGVPVKAAGGPTRGDAANPSGAPSVATSVEPFGAGGAAPASDGGRGRAAVHAAPHARFGAPEVAAAIALAMLLAAVVVRRVARRIGPNGAVLRHHADLLRQLDPAYRARLHDRGRGRLRAPSATARS